MQPDRQAYQRALPDTEPTNFSVLIQSPKGEVYVTTECAVVALRVAVREVYGLAENGRNGEMQKAATERAKRVTVLYDADCGFCRWLVSWVLRWDRWHRLNAEPIQGPAGNRVLSDLSAEERLASWHSFDNLGKRASGAAAFPHVLRVLPGGAPLARLADGAPTAVDACYRFVSGRRRFWGRLLPRRAIKRADDIIASHRAS